MTDAWTPARALALPRPPEQAPPLVPSWRPVLEAFCGTLDSPHTIRSYRFDVEQAMYAMRVRDLRELTGGALTLWRGAVMASAGAPLSKHRRIVAVRSFLRFGAAAGACAHITRDLLDVALPVPRAEAQEGHRPLTDDQLARLLARCVTAYERAIIAVLCSSAPRRAELAALDCADVVDEEDGWVLRIRQGKGGRSRIVPMAPDVAELVTGHLAEEGRIPGDTGPLFYGAGGRIRDDEVYSIVRRLAAAAGLGSEGISPHDLRATAAMRVYRHTKDVYAVQALLGHRSLQSTQRYLANLTAGELRASIPPLPQPTPPDAARRPAARRSARGADWAPPVDIPSADLRKNRRPTGWDDEEEED